MSYNFESHIYSYKKMNSTQYLIGYTDLMKKKDDTTYLTLIYYDHSNKEFLTKFYFFSEDNYNKITQIFDEIIQVNKLDLSCFDAK